MIIDEEKFNIKNIIQAKIAIEFYNIISIKENNTYLKIHNIEDNISSNF
jgi:hypothetical protein